MTIEEMRIRRKELHMTLRSLAEQSGVPLPTVQKIFAGTTSSPRYRTLKALERALEPQREVEGYSLTPPEPLSVAEEPLVYGSAVPQRVKKQGEYTLEDYLALPEERRVELIDGVFYDMAAPTSPHQLIAAEIYRQLADFIRSRGGSCIPFIAPTDVQLDCDDRTIVQPDVFVVCRRDRILRARFYGAPDLVIEVLSPSTYSKDMRLKRNKYEDAGVREYWLADPDRRRVIVYLFGEPQDIFISGFDAQVPVNIFGDECLIDFREVWNMISFLYEDE